VRTAWARAAGGAGTATAQAPAWLPSRSRARASPRALLHTRTSRQMVMPPLPRAREAAEAPRLLDTCARAPAAAALVVAQLGVWNRRALRLTHPQLRDAVEEATTKLRVAECAIGVPTAPGLGAQVLRGRRRRSAGRDSIRSWLLFSSRKPWRRSGQGQGSGTSLRALPSEPAPTLVVLCGTWPARARWRRLCAGCPRCARSSLAAWGFQAHRTANSSAPHLRRQCPSCLCSMLLSRGTRADSDAQAGRERLAPRGAEAAR
jgi:hypothetical protein